MSNLSKNQLILIDELKEDIELYREDLKGQIITTQILMYVGIGLAVVAGILMLIFPDILTNLKELSDNLGTIAGVVGEIVPVTLASKSFSNVKTQKKKLKGLRAFDKDLNRMELGILPNDVEHIIGVEQEFIRYVNT